MYKTKASLIKIKCPTFIAQGIDDDTVRSNSADYIFYNLSSNNKVKKFYNNSGHLILWSEAAKEVIYDISEFLNNLDKVEGARK